MKQLTATIITALFCAACGTTQLKNSLALELSDVDAIHIMPGTPHPIRADNAKIISTAELLDMVRQVDYIKLDSSEPIGVIDKMIVTKDKIYILDCYTAQQIFVFDKTGRRPNKKAYEATNSHNYNRPILRCLRNFATKRQQGISTVRHENY